MLFIICIEITEW